MCSFAWIDFIDFRCVQSNTFSQFSCVCEEFGNFLHVTSYVNNVASSLPAAIDNDQLMRFLLKLNTGMIFSHL